jgi:hypothetical protein
VVKAGCVPLAHLGSIPIGRGCLTENFILNSSALTVTGKISWLRFFF